MRGLYFEEFEVGKHYKHAMTRTVTEMDNVMFTSLTMNIQPLHLDEEFCKTTIHKQRVVNSLFTVALIGAFHVPELTMGTTLGNLGYDFTVAGPMTSLSHCLERFESANGPMFTECRSL